MPEGLLVKLHITDLAIVGEAGECSQDRCAITNSQQSLGKSPIVSLVLMLQVIFEIT